VSENVQSLLLMVALVYTPLLWGAMMLLAVKVQEWERRRKNESSQVRDR
jgi:hypothetical protein